MIATHSQPQSLPAGAGKPTSEVAGPGRTFDRSKDDRALSHQASLGPDPLPRQDPAIVRPLHEDSQGPQIILPSTATHPQGPDEGNALDSCLSSDRSEYRALQ